MSISVIDKTKNNFEHETDKDRMIEQLLRENARLREQLHETQSTLFLTTQAYLQSALESKCDSLTGVFNRQGMIDTLEHIIERPQEASTSPQSAIIAIDLNKFKLINDTYGHQAGDEALIVVAQALQSCVRKTDVVARRSGDEFVVILDDCNEDVVTKKVKEIRQMFSSLSFEYEGQVIEVGGSVGWHMMDNTLNATENLVRADRYLYANKKAVNDNRESSAANLRSIIAPTP